MLIFNSPFAISVRDFFSFSPIFNYPFKKRFLSFLLFAVLAPTYGQSRIGHQLDTLKNEFRDESYNTLIIQSEESLSMQILTKESKIIYIFDQPSKICEITIIYPFSADVKEKLVKRYNDNYITLSPTRWQNKVDDVIYEITLSQEVDTGQVCFIWTYRVEPMAN